MKSRAPASPAPEIPGIPPEAASGILALIARIPGIEQAILFGSRAKGNPREGSDIDIALVGAIPGREALDEFFRSYETLDLPWKIDLAIYSAIENPELKAHIDRVGIRIFTKGA